MIHLTQHIDKMIEHLNRHQSIIEQLTIFEGRLNLLCKFFTRQTGHTNFTEHGEIDVPFRINIERRRSLRRASQIRICSADTCRLQRQVVLGSSLGSERTANHDIQFISTLELKQLNIGSQSRDLRGITEVLKVRNFLIRSARAEQECRDSDRVDR